MADKSTRLIVDALTRAAAEPAGLPLFAAKANPGLFPSTSAAKTLAHRCRDDGLIQIQSSNDRMNREIGTITEKGMDWLLSRSSPKQILEDFLRVLERKQAQAAELIAAARQMAAGLESLRGAVERIRVSDVQAHHAAPASFHVPEQHLLSLLETWHASSSGDCPLPELFHRLTTSHPGLSIGRFHDALRRLHDEHRIYLHPWTGPLYDLPEPPFALLIGHEIAYYASPR